MTPEEIQAQNIAIAEQANGEAAIAAGGTEDEIAARAAAAALEVGDLSGNVDHNGSPAVREDTPEELAAIEAARVAEEAKTKAAADEKAEADRVAALTPEEKVAEEAAKIKAEAEKKVADEAAAEEAAKNAEWMVSESVEFNSAINLMKDAGMTPAEASTIFDEAAQTGDVSKVDRAALVEKIGEDRANLVLAGFNSYVAKEGEAVLQRLNTVQEAVGGADNWSSMIKWARVKAANDTAFRDEVTEINKMMNEGSTTASTLAAKHFKELYNADPKNSTITTVKVDPVVPHNKPAVPAVSSATPISAREYADQMEAADRDLRGTAKVAKLREIQANREAGRRAGM